jgi:hypothetical protein
LRAKCILNQKHYFRVLKWQTQTNQLEPIEKGKLGIEEGIQNEDILTDEQ